VVFCGIGLRRFAYRPIFLQLVFWFPIRILGAVVPLFWLGGGQFIAVGLFHPEIEKLLFFFREQNFQVLAEGLKKAAMQTFDSVRCVCDLSGVISVVSGCGQWVWSVVVVSGCGVISGVISVV